MNISSFFFADFVIKHYSFISFKRTWRLSMENSGFCVISGSERRDDGDDCEYNVSEFFF